MKENQKLMNVEYFEKVASYVLKKTGLDAEAEDLLLTFKAASEYIAETLGENKGEEPFSLTLPGYFEFTVSTREGNVGVSITAEDEFKKRVKDDEMFDSDDEDEE